MDLYQFSIRAHFVGQASGGSQSYDDDRLSFLFSIKFTCRNARIVSGTSRIKKHRVRVRITRVRYPEWEREREKRVTLIFHDQVFCSFGPMNIQPTEKGKENRERKMIVKQAFYPPFFRIYFTLLSSNPVWLKEQISSFFIIFLNIQPSKSSPIVFMLNRSVNQIRGCWR